MGNETVKIGNLTYTRKRRGQLWTGQDGNLYNIYNGQAIPLTKTSKNYNPGGLKGFANNFLPDHLRLYDEIHVPVLENLVDLGGTPSNDTRTSALRNADRVNDMDSPNPVVRAKYTLLEDPKEGVTDGLKRTVAPALLGASLPYSFTSIPAFLYTTGAYTAGAAGGKVGNVVGENVAKLLTDDDEIIRNSGKVGETTGSLVAGAKLNPGSWLLRQARGAIANNVTPQGYENISEYGFNTKSKYDEGMDALRLMFSWKGLTEGTTMKPGQMPLWMQRALANGSNVDLSTMPYFRNIAWKKVLKQPLTAEENSVYVPINGRLPSTYDLFFNQYQRNRPLEDYGSSVVETYNLEHPAIVKAFNRNNLRNAGGKWDNFSDMYDQFTNFGTNKNGFKDWFTTNGGNIGLKYNVDKDTYSMIDGWDIQPFKSQKIAYPFKPQINKILESKYVPGKLKDIIQNFEVVSQLGGRPIIWRLELSR